MREIHGGTIEKVGMGLVCSVETFKGCQIKLVKRVLGFNGLSTYKSGEARKIELKTMQKSDYWIAINGFTAIEKLFFDKNYWLYFALVPENIVVMAKALPFINNQLPVSKNGSGDYLKVLKDWIKLTKNLSKKSGLQFIPRINIKFRVPLRDIVKETKDTRLGDIWRTSIFEIWENKGAWHCLYKN